jgi:hypothetical protein
MQGSEGLKFLHGSRGFAERRARLSGWDDSVHLLQSRTAAALGLNRLRIVRRSQVAFSVCCLDDVMRVSRVTQAKVTTCQFSAASAKARRCRFHWCDRRRCIDGAAHSVAVSSSRSSRSVSDLKRHSHMSSELEGMDARPQSSFRVRRDRKDAQKLAREAE